MFEAIKFIMCKRKQERKFQATVMLVSFEFYPYFLSAASVFAVLTNSHEIFDGL